MANLLMITGFGGTHLADKGAFYQTLEEFRRHWDRIDVIAPGSRWSFLPPREEVLFNTVHVHTSPWPVWLQPWFIFQKGHSLFFRHGFHVVTVHEYAPFYNGLGAWLLSFVARVPYVLEIMHIPGYPFAGNIKERIYRYATQLVIPIEARYARLVRVINQPLAAMLSRFMRDSWRKVKVIPAMYIDLDVFYPMDVPKQYDLIFVGRLVPNKGILLLLEAIRMSSLSALIVGDGPLFSQISSFVTQHALSSRVTLGGWAPDAQAIAGLLNQARLFVLPSYNEGGPRVVLEAMACGVPVLATPVGIVPDLIGNNERGIVLSWDAQDIVRGAEELLGDPTRYRQYSNAGREIVQDYERSKSVKYYADSLKALV